jgi:hypothetical protein
MPSMPENLGNGKTKRVFKHQYVLTRKAQPNSDREKPPQWAAFCGELLVQSNFELKF